MHEIQYSWGVGELATGSRGEGRGGGGHPLHRNSPRWLITYIWLQILRAVHAVSCTPVIAPYSDKTVVYEEHSNCQRRLFERKQ